MTTADQSKTLRIFEIWCCMVSQIGIKTFALSMPTPMSIIRYTLPPKIVWRPITPKNDARISMNKPTSRRNQVTVIDMLNIIYLGINPIDYGSTWQIGRDLRQLLCSTLPLRFYVHGRIDQARYLPTSLSQQSYQKHGTSCRQ